jgi:hypothetical protein
MGTPIEFLFVQDPSYRTLGYPINISAEQVCEYRLYPAVGDDFIK